MPKKSDELPWRTADEVLDELEEYVWNLPLTDRQKKSIVAECVILAETAKMEVAQDYPYGGCP